MAALYPEKSAVDDGLIKLTYNDVLHAAQDLAIRIEALVPRGSAVGIFLPNGSLFPVATLACLAAGRICIPIDPHYPPERNEIIFQDAGLAAVITGSDAGPFVSSLKNLPRIEIHRSLGSKKRSNEIPIAPVDGPAFVVYTSGSTGRPKGICNDQRAISQRVASFTNICQLNSSDRFILLSSPGTIAGVRDTFAALLNGATLHISDPYKVGIGGILDTLRTQRITICYAVPALLRELLELPNAKQACADLRVLRLGGDIVLSSDIHLCRASLPNSCQILVGYGSTEAPTIFQWLVPKNLPLDGQRVPCGYPSPDLSISLITENGTRANCGEIGEVVVSSRYIALGLWQNGQLQPGIFQVDPEDPQSRIIQTGDLAKVRPDGLIELVGRKDRQIKIRGLIVDPVEVESVLRRGDAISDVAVISAGVDNVDSLVAYVVPRAPVCATLRENLHKAAKNLPPHMRPARIHVVEAIPRLPGFKPDITALQKLAHSDFDPPQRMLNGPVTELESKVLSTVRRILKNEKIEISDNFFDSGGNSLLGMKFMLEVEAQLGLDISLEAIFNTPTIEALCNSLDVFSEKSPAVILPIVSRSGDPTLYFTHSAFDFKPLSNALDDVSSAFVTINGAKWFRKMVDNADALAAIDQISHAYAETILARHKTGRCYLAGHSFGGILAIETACKLQALGAAPDIVFLFDTYLHGAARRIFFNILHNGLLTSKFRELLDGNWIEVQRRARFLFRSIFSRTQQLDLDKQPEVEPEEFMTTTFRDLRERASQAYRGPNQLLTSPLVLFRATKTFSGKTIKFDPDLGWARHLANLTIVPTPGNHFSLMSAEHVTYLAAEIAKFIAANRDPDEAWSRPI